MMGLKMKKAGMFFACSLCSLALLSGCAMEKEASPAEGDGMGDTQAEAVQEDQNQIQDTYKPSALTIPSQERYEYPDLGLSFSLPESLMKRMDRQEAAMISQEETVEEGTRIRYVAISWKCMTEEQRDAEVESSGNGFYDWADSLEPIGAIGVYQPDAAEDLDQLTGCTEHQEIGRSGDGDYIYYLSVNPEADSAMKDEIGDIAYEITAMTSLEDTMDSVEKETFVTGNIGEFSMEDIEGKTYTQEMFQDHKLTMVNIFATWCTPCVNEIPDLDKLKKEMASQGVYVVGIVLDTVDASGKVNEEAVEKARILAERTGAAYPFLIPDESYMNGRLLGIDAVPETFFIDQEGNITGGTYSGSHSLEDWKTIVEKELKGVKQ